ncbi:MAG TPA: exodeoxyribonuclease VII small subunit [Ktedonobacterales bacterium]|jgi:exodeoxyribonuclease VII small subunit
MQRERRGRRANGSDPSRSSQPATDVALDGLADYDKAMAEIDDIIARLEDGQHSLDEEMQLYERAMRLAHACDQLLQNAELRVEKLRSDLSVGQASFTLEEFEIDDE